MQCLHQAGLIRPLTLAGDLALVAAEGLEEVGRHRGVEQLNRSRTVGVERGLFGGAIAQGQFRELLPDAGDIGDGILQHLGTQASWKTPRIMPPVFPVGRQNFGGTPIRLRNQDLPHQRLQIKPMAHQVIGQSGQESLVGGRIGGAQIIHRLNQTHAQVMRPNAVGDGPGEVWIGGCGQPVGQHLATIAGIGRRHGGGVQRRRRLGLSRPGLNEVSGSLDVQLALPIAIARIPAPTLGSDPRKEVGKLVVLVVGPLLERMIVATGAVDGERQESLAHILGHGFRILVNGEEVRLPFIDRRPLGRDHLTHEPVPRRVVGHLIANPSVVRFDGRWSQSGPADEQHVRPLVGPEIHILRSAQEPIGQTGVLVGPRILDECPHLGRCRQAAQRVERRPADEGGVGGRRRGLQVQALQLVQHQGVESTRARSGGIDGIGNFGGIR